MLIVCLLYNTAWGGPSGVIACGIQIHKNRKIPDHLADFCKCSRENQTAAGSRLPRSSHVFLYFSNSLGKLRPL